MREGGFGFSNSALSTSITEPKWEVAALLRSHQPAESSTRHWGLELGDSAQNGRLESVQKLLDTALMSRLSNSRARANVTTHFEMGDAELEAKVGTMFGALDLALHGRYPQIAITLLEKMIFLFEHQQGKPSVSTALDVHAVLICESPDTPFCESAWSESALYIAIILGYLRKSLAMLRGNKDQFLNHAALESRVVPSLPKQLQLIIYQGWQNFDTQPDSGRGQAEEQPHNILQCKESLPLDQITSIREEVYETCEQARLLWKSKRNRKEAFAIFFRRELTDEDRVNGEGSVDMSWIGSILKFLISIGVDVNSLDRAGQTLLYWARLRSWSGIAFRLESLGGKLFAPRELSLREIRISILTLLGELDSPQDAASFGTTALDLSRKWEWDKLGRYLYFGGDPGNAVRCFEASAVFDTTVPGNVPAFHYFNCDSCFTEYSYDNLLRGMRFVPRGLVNVDLCQACAQILGEEAKVGVPSPEWIRDRKTVHEAEIRAFNEIDEADEETAMKDKAKAEWKKRVSIELRTRIQAWVRQLKKDWEHADQRDHLARFVTAQEHFKQWLFNDEAEKALMELRKIDKW